VIPPTRPGARLDLHWPPVPHGDVLPGVDGDSRMRNASLVLLTMTLLIVLTVPPGAARALERPEPPSAAEAHALGLLRWAAKAGAETGYTGVQMVSAQSVDGSVGFVVDIDHMPGDGTAVHVRGSDEVPDGTSVMLPAGTGPRAATTASVPGATAWIGAPASPSADPDALSLLSRNYDLAVEGYADVVGRDAMVIGASLDGEPAGRFWIDEHTGLMLRREVYDASGATVRASAFVDLAPARSRFVLQLPPEVGASWKAQAREADVGVLRSRGWTCPATLAKTLGLRAASLTTGSDDGDVVHLSYSDGLSTVSVFEQHGHLDPTRLAGFRAVDTPSGRVYVGAGLPQRFVWSARGTVFTLLADAPGEVVEEALAALPHEAGDNGAVPRIQRGMSRVASWFNPFA
jgi:sigma-E factor negative regulatory protein RseB